MGAEQSAAMDCGAVGDVVVPMDGGYMSNIVLRVYYLNYVAALWGLT